MIDQSLEGTVSYVEETEILFPTYSNERKLVDVKLGDLEREKFLNVRRVRILNTPDGCPIVDEEHTSRVTSGEHLIISVLNHEANVFILDKHGFLGVILELESVSILVKLEPDHPSVLSLVSFML